MDYKECLYDISIAKDALSQSLLDVTVSSSRIICEVYCLTSFQKTFYLQVYDGDQYTLLFVKPFFRTPQGLSSWSVPFSTIIEAEKHPAYCGDIYCGIKLLPKSNTIINTLKHCLPSITEILPESRITIDGTTTLIINHKTTEPTTLYFRNEETFQRNSYSPEEAHFLHDLFLQLEPIIGNLIRDSR